MGSPLLKHPQPPGKSQQTGKLGQLQGRRSTLPQLPMEADPRCAVNITRLGDKGKRQSPREGRTVFKAEFTPNKVHDTWCAHSETSAQMSSGSLRDKNHSIFSLEVQSFLLATSGHHSRLPRSTRL